MNSSNSFRFDFGRTISRNGSVLRSTSSGTESIGYLLDDLPIVRTLGRQLSERQSDLIEVFLAIAAADRFAPRRNTRDHWHRNIEVTIPVRHPLRWRSKDVSECLAELVRWTTDDNWLIDFVPRNGDRRVCELQTVMPFVESSQPQVMLFSGGLDSTLGLINALGGPDASQIVPVTIVTNARIRDISKRVIDALRASDTGKEMLPVQISARFTANPVLRKDTETSYRARALLFLAAGAVTALCAGVGELHLTENGIGAISLPFTPDQLGAMMTRATHPRTLRLISDLVSFVNERDFRVINDGFRFTKKELCQQYLTEQFAPAAALSVSCDRVTYDPNPCGHCSSCILRAISLSGILSGHSERTVPRGQNDYSAMAYQVAVLRQVPDAASLLDQYPELWCVSERSTNDSEDQNILDSQVLRLYRQYVQEFDQFFTRMDILPLASGPMPEDMNRLELAS